MTTLVFDIPDDLWLSANDRLHWAPTAKRTRGLRDMGRLVARSEKVRDLGPSLVVAHIGYPRNGRADPANAAPTVKALIDGITDAGAWPDDDSTNVLGPMYLRDPATGKPGIHTVRLVMTSQEVPF